MPFMQPDLQDRHRFRNKPDAVAKYLSKAFETNDLDACLAAMNRVMRAQNVLLMAEEAGLSRTRLYKTFSGKREPLLGSIMSLFSAMGVVLTVKATPPGKKVPPLNIGKRLRTRRIGARASMSKS